MASCQTLKSRNEDDDITATSTLNPSSWYIGLSVMNDQEEGALANDRRRATTSDQGRVLGNDQLAAVLLFQRHSFVERGDGALRLVVGRRLGGDALQPEAGSGH